MPYHHQVYLLGSLYQFLESECYLLSGPLLNLVCADGDCDYGSGRGWIEK